MLKDNEMPIIRLKKAIISQKNAQFPERPEESQLAKLHDLIYQYDQHVAQMVISVLQGSSEAVAFERANDIAMLIDRMSPSPGQSMNRLIEQYRRYKERLDNMSALALEVVSERKNNIS